PGERKVLERCKLVGDSHQSQYRQAWFICPFGTPIPQQLSANGFELLRLEVTHAAALIGLPFHHRDPFDRLLIAPAMVEQMQIVSIDSAFDAYPITRLW